MRKLEILLIFLILKFMFVVFLAYDVVAYPLGSFSWSFTVRQKLPPKLLEFYLYGKSLFAYGNIKPFTLWNFLID
jgi:hypothetical protein